MSLVLILFNYHYIAFNYKRLLKIHIISGKSNANNLKRVYLDN